MGGVVLPMFINFAIANGSRYHASARPWVEYISAAIQPAMPEGTYRRRKDMGRLFYLEATLRSPLLNLKYLRPVLQS